MRSVSSMSDAEIRERLKFTRRWFDLGIVDDAWVAVAVREYRESDDQGDEHYRYGSFVHYLGRHPVLTPEQCRDLFELGAEDPDQCMGTSVMLDVLRRTECPDELYDIAASHPRTWKYAEEMRCRRELNREAARHRKALQARGPENYYRDHGFRKRGKTRRDETVFTEMEDLFAIDWKQFHKIKNATPRPAG